MEDPSPIGDVIENAVEDWFNSASLDQLMWAVKDIGTTSSSLTNKALLTKINARIDQLLREKKENK